MAGRRHSEAKFAVVVSCLALAIAGAALLVSRPDAAAYRGPVAAVETGPIAHMQWQETLKSAFTDLEKMPATLPNRGTGGFNLATPPDASMLAQPDVPPGRFM